MRGDFILVAFKFYDEPYMDTKLELSNNLKNSLVLKTALAIKLKLTFNSKFLECPSISFAIYCLGEQYLNVCRVWNDLLKCKTLCQIQR